MPRVVDCKTSEQCKESVIQDILSGHLFKRFLERVIWLESAVVLIISQSECLFMSFIVIG